MLSVHSLHYYCCSQPKVRKVLRWNKVVTKHRHAPRPLIDPTLTDWVQSYTPCCCYPSS
ncbi:hypothetical protein BDP81DRAFT_435567 [Colletotrichum phormii]|uniref:Uncharacterized protein n=1 Tax=Colletotrichum phormii TaxID=359342 RepID=A0AAI9ZJE3_9PEZI|nr:uncharacterized protein BDP81DRAFT_435567 [Colletotrichum phormii]KAK1625318.1 hypothetical protein BDP81DRAFT_435567 [Colletotrichum phormii]